MTGLSTTMKYIIMLFLLSMGALVSYHFANAYPDVSDTHARAEMKRVQAEMLFIDARKGVFKEACFSGVIGSIVQDLVAEYGKEVTCRTNKPMYSQMMVFIELRNGKYLAVDGSGVSCELSVRPVQGLLCKDNF